MTMAAYSGEVTPTEDDYTNGKTSTKEYEPGTCCIATVRILGEGCRAVDGSNARKWPNSRFAYCCKHFFSQALQGRPRHHFRSRLAKRADRRAAQYASFAERLDAPMLAI